MRVPQIYEGFLNPQGERGLKPPENRETKSLNFID